MQAVRCLIPILAVLLAEPAPAAGTAERGAAFDPVPVEVFSEAGCPECELLRQEVLPEIERRYAGYCRLDLLDIGVETNYLRLVEYRRRLGAGGGNEAVTLVVDGVVMLPGLDRIRRDVFAALDAALGRRLAGAERYPVSHEPADDARERLRGHVREFTVPGIVAAALVDSLNPCAVATLVFFLSLLGVSHLGTRRTLLAGGAFLAGCYAAYFAIGFGLLHVLKVVDGLRPFRWLLNTALAAAMLILSAFSFRDAWRFRRTGRASDVTLKLPDGVQGRIHDIMRRGLRTRNLALGGAGIGAAVTLLESVCTGQVYVPALVLMIKAGEDMVRSTLYLALYNAIFVLPLALLLGLTCLGLGTPALVDWSRRNVVVSKVLLGLFFLAMTGMMLALTR